MSSKALTIYDAAAGAGKTYTLVKNYLLKLLSSNNNGRYKQILAITFTNKAVSEMKERILSTLYKFSLKEPDGNDNPMFSEIQNILQLDDVTLKKRSLDVLNFILHNYTAFSVQTIDKFTQSIIRTFAFDLNLSNSFEVQLDQKIILEEAVDQLLMEVGKEEKVTSIVLKYVAQQIENDKSWDIKLLLIDLGMLLFSESDQAYIKSLESLTVASFFELEKEYQKSILGNENSIKQKATSLLEKLDQENIIDDFTRGTLPKYFKKLAEEGNHLLSGFILKNIAEESLYAKSKSDSTKAKINELRPHIESIFNETKELIYKNKLSEGILKNLPAMSLLNVLNTKIIILKKEKNQVLISEFNALIAENIKDQPTPFIYERLGEKYKDFFIDEFQDTSEVQWNNLTPLIDNALSSYIETTKKTGTATLVGDAKQSIYRWRGGKAEQFIALSEGHSPFSNPEKNSFQLDTNYRSYSEIINFNNHFFTYLSDFLSNESHKTLYKKGNQQNVNTKKGGYISLEYFDANTKSEKSEVYPEAVKKYIDEAVSDNFSYKDIAILVRKNSEGILISNYLIEQGIPVISSESLLIKNALEVQLLEATLNYLCDTENSAHRLNFIKTLSSFLKKKINSEDLKSLLKTTPELFEDALKTVFGINLRNLFSNNQSIYQLLENLTHTFCLHNKSSANLQFFLDISFDYCNSNNGSLQQFIDYWDQKKDKLSIITSEGQEGVKVMTIHKSKGLEFPIVILPYLDESLYNFKTSNIWINNHRSSPQITHLYWRFNRKVFDFYKTSLIENHNDIISSEELDIINVLYVAFTRSVKRLYLLGSTKDANTSLEKGNITAFLNDFFKTQNTEQKDLRYTIGEKQKNNIHEAQSQSTILLENFIIKKASISTSLTNHKSTSAQIGDFVHLVLSKIYDRSDFNKVSEFIERTSLINHNEIILLKNQIKALINHTIFSNYFNRNNTIYNERDFIVNTEIMRPDRLEISRENEVIILDYKTGSENKQYNDQLNKYESFVKNMGYKNVKKYLVYLNETLKIIEVQ